MLFEGPEKKVEIDTSCSERFIDHLNKLSSELYDLNNPQEFHEYLKHNNAKELATEIKNKFKGKKGKQIALLISDLIHRDPPILIISGRENARFYRSMTKYFKYSVGSDQSINNYLNIPKNQIKNPEHFKEEIQSTKTIVDSILSSIAKTS